MTNHQPLKRVLLRIVDLATFMQINGSSALCWVIGFSPDSPLLCKKRFQGFIHTSPDITEVNNQTCTVCFNYEGDFFPIVIACKESYPIWCIFVTSAFTLTLIVQWCWMSQTIKHILLERPGISVCWFYGSRTANGLSDQAMCFDVSNLIYRICVFLYIKYSVGLYLTLPNLNQSPARCARSYSRKTEASALSRALQFAPQ